MFSISLKSYHKQQEQHHLPTYTVKQSEKSHTDKSHHYPPTKNP